MLDASSIMSRHVMTVLPTHTVAHVARLLMDREISAVQICDNDGALLGMASEGDLIRPFVGSNVKRRGWWLTVLADCTDLAPKFLEYVRLARHRVAT